jgi:hypothetical protein
MPANAIQMAAAGCRKVALVQQLLITSPFAYSL